MVTKRWGRPMAMTRDDMVHVPDPTAPDTIANSPDQHAFVTLGRNTLFLCHLTMYGMEPHMYQLVLEATLPKWAEEKYRYERNEHPGDTYFLGNSKLDLLTVPELSSRARTWFMADLFRGIPYREKYEEWPWNGQKAVIANVRVDIRRIVHYRPFALNMNYPETLTYLLFGAGVEAHMTNWQTKEPDFDHILSLKSAPEWVGERELEAGILVDVPDVSRAPDGEKVYCSVPLRDGSSLRVRYRGDPSRHAPHRLIQVDRSYWFCTKVANLENPCPNSTTRCASEPPAAAHADRE